METKKIQTLIESLTDNQDYQQELWVAYLCGNLDLSVALDIIKQKHQEIEQFQIQTQALIHHIHNPIMLQILESLTGYDHMILCLLIIGYNAKDISKYCNICLVRVRQAIYAIQTNEHWKKMQ